MSIVTIERKVLEKNDEIAQRNRSFFDERGVFVVNLVSSPGSGKTSILEQTLGRLQKRVKVAVIEGDVQTDLDAQRIARFDIPVIQIVTNGGCHLEAKLIQDAMTNLDFDGIQLLVIENVGNLVCPANYDLGEAHKIVILSTTEGEDKPLKYPGMFQKASVLIINKMDLVPHLKCDVEALRRNALQINPRLQVFETSCATGAGMEEWCKWIEKNIVKKN